MTMVSQRITATTCTACGCRHSTVQQARLSETCCRQAMGQEEKVSYNEYTTLSLRKREEEIKIEILYVILIVYTRI